MEATIQHSSRKNRAILFDRLDRFVNMGNGQADVAAFLRYAPGFFPEMQRPVMQPDVKPTVPHTGLVRLRDYLREVWRGRDANGQKLSTLLGLATWNDADVAADLYWLLHLDRTSAVANWQTGSFDYVPGCQFQEAVYALMCDSWRAKVCEMCERYYIADKSRQRYCSVPCSVAAQSKAQLAYWNRRGKQKRRERATAKRRRKRAKK